MLKDETKTTRASAEMIGVKSTKKPTNPYLLNPVKRTRARESLRLAELLHALRITGCTASTGDHTAELPSRAQPTKVSFHHQLTSTDTNLI